MSSTGIIVLIIVIVVVAALIALAWSLTRRATLRKKFGPEYDRVVAERDSRSAGEKELRERERRHAALELRPLTDEARTSYASRWAEVQAQFVDSPEDAVRAGHELVTQLIAEIGYPTDDADEQLATLSVEHARTLSHYRDAHEIYERNERAEASTEQLRQALVHYRALFSELLGGGTPVPPVQPDAETAPAETISAETQA
jgi:hypothetical protein